MLTIKDEQTMEKVTPDMTVKEIREIKKESSDEPTDDDIRLFFNRNLRHCINPEQFADLKKYMYENYRNAGGGGDGCDYKGSSRGITLNHHDEITWAKFVSRVYLLEDLVPDSISNQSKQEDILPGQMELESDFPEYCPEKVKAESVDIIKSEEEKENCDVANERETINFPEKKEVVIDGEFREVFAETKKGSDEVKMLLKEADLVSGEIYDYFMDAVEVSNIINLSDLELFKKKTEQLAVIIDKIMLLRNRV